MTKRHLVGGGGGAPSFDPPMASAHGQAARTKSRHHSRRWSRHECDATGRFLAWQPACGAYTVGQLLWYYVLQWVTQVSATGSLATRVGDLLR